MTEEEFIKELKTVMPKMVLYLRWTPEGFSDEAKAYMKRGIEAGIFLREPTSEDEEVTLYCKDGLIDAKILQLKESILNFIKTKFQNGWKDEE